MSGTNKNKNYKRKKRYLNSDPILKKLRAAKTEFHNNFYRKYTYKNKMLLIDINDSFGLEHDFGNFIKISGQFIESKAKKYIFNITNSPRIWPSAVTLLCSFKQWTEITAEQRHYPYIFLSTPKSQEVDGYLFHCGFYNYVNVPDEIPDFDIKPYDDKEIVKIRRENDKSDIQTREDDIFKLLKDYSTLSDDELESFDCIVLIEAFNNVTEHGHSYRDNGWWTFSQYHKRTGMISVCIADNGIGIKNSLLLGPQKEEIKKLVKNDDDHEFLMLALEANVSGALRASTRDEREYLVLNNYPKGSRRGNGLKRIRDTCKSCGIKFNILSQNGYLSIDENGTIIESGTSKTRIFAGTFYHFIIPAKKQIEVM